MLNTYLADTRALLQNPSATASLYADSALVSFINMARRQLSAEAQCIRVFGTLATVASQRVYPFSAFDVSGTTGVQGVIDVRQGQVVVGSGASRLNHRPFPYFMQYYMNNAAPVNARPVDWAQYAEGFNGSIYLDPIPDTVYTLNFDTVCLPVDLADDSTPEAIPVLWTDAVRFYACYMALSSAQRMGDADRMFQQYTQFMSRARTGSTPEVLSTTYPGNPDPTNQNKLGMHPPRQRGG